MQEQAPRHGNAAAPVCMRGMQGMQGRVQSGSLRPNWPKGCSPQVWSSHKFTASPYSSRIAHRGSWRCQLHEKARRQAWSSHKLAVSTHSSRIAARRRGKAVGGKEIEIQPGPRLKALVDVHHGAVAEIYLGLQLRGGTAPCARTDISNRRAGH